MFRYRQRPTTVARCAARDVRGIFQSDPVLPVSIQEAREAYNCRDKAIYQTLCIDGEMVERYIHVVEDLERAYRISDPSFTFTLFGFITINIVVARWLKD